MARSKSCPITPGIIELAVRAGVCPEAIEWARERPRTIEELVAYRPDWAEWLATQVPDLPEPVAQELLWRIGARAWWRNGSHHRDDGPALIRADGSLFWFRYDVLHCDDGPAAIYTAGAMEWYRDGKLHREDGPAAIWADGTQKWYRDGKLHREDGPAVLWYDGTQLWFRNGELHREDGPAIVQADGTQKWYRNGNLHRDDGPAIIYPGGRKQWYRDGIRLPEPAPEDTEPEERDSQDDYQEYIAEETRRFLERESKYSS